MRAKNAGRTRIQRAPLNSIVIFKNEETAMWQIENEFSVKLGGNTYINTPNLIVVQGESLFKIYRSESDGILGIDFDVYNSSRAKVATIRKGIVVSGDEAAYEISSSHEKYSVTDKSSGKEIVSVQRRNVSGAELEVSVELYTKTGFLINATPTSTNVGGMMMTGNVFKDCGAGLVIE